MRNVRDNSLQFAFTFWIQKVKRFHELTWLQCLSNWLGHNGSIFTCTEIILKREQRVNVKRWNTSCFAFLERQNIMCFHVLVLWMLNYLQICPILLKAHTLIYYLSNYNLHFMFSRYMKFYFVGAPLVPAVSTFVLFCCCFPNWGLPRVWTACASMS